MKKYIAAVLVAATTAVISGCATGQVNGTPVENVESSAIKNVGYDAETSVLVVTFINKQAYKFMQVPAEEYEALMKADSKGQYFNNKINGSYRYETVE